MDPLEIDMILASFQQMETASNKSFLFAMAHPEAFLQLHLNDNMLQKMNQFDLLPKRPLLAKKRNLRMGTTAVVGLWTKKEIVKFLRAQKCKRSSFDQKNKPIPAGLGVNCAGGVGDIICK